jgi:8-oxo-dGTP pyrophosphatase MutT (NUDIX family)
MRESPKILDSYILIRFKLLYLYLRRSIILNIMNNYCNNCGIVGHLYKHCKHPVLSYGILCIHNSKLLMIQRKDSIGYIEFLRGKYKINNPEYILELLNRCSLTEREQIKTLSFDDLWSKLWFSGKEKKKQTERMIKEYRKSKMLFETINTGLLQTLLSRCDTQYDTPEWEFPKGRRSSRECNLSCAIREFEEETDLNKEEYNLLKNIKPITEEFVGSNGVRYKHIYYYAFYTGDRSLSINKHKYEQYSEISNIGWLTIEECYSKIRGNNSTKHDIIKHVALFIENWTCDFILKE